MQTTAPAPTATVRPLRSLPGPRGWPLFGNAFQIRRDTFHQQLDAWADQYGDKFRFTIAAREFLAIRDPETVQSVLRQRPGVFKKGARLEEVTRDLGFHGVFSANGDAWRRQRPVVLAGLDPAHIRAFLPAILGITDRLRDRWLEAAATGTRFDLVHDLMRYTVDVTTALAFGHNLNTLEKGDDVAIQQHLNRILPAMFRRNLAPIDIYRWLDRRTRVHVKALQEAVDTFIAQARQQLEENPALRERPVNLIQALVAANQRGDGGMSDAEVSGNVLTMLLAGEDTTANTLAWMLWLLYRNPEAAALARAEAVRVVGDGGVVTSIEQLAQLDVVEACAMESMRLKPVAPLNFTEAAEDTVVDGVLVPKGALVACMMRPAGLKEANFPAPQAFDPQRWLEGRNEGNALSAAKRVVMPFGAGPRICPGRYLALAEIKMVAAMLLANFELKYVGTADGADPAERLALTMAPQGLEMELRAR
jgi:cytochrome P450